MTHPDEDLLDLYEHAPCGYLLLDRDHVVRRVNQTFLDLTGHPRDAVLGSRWQQLLAVGSRIHFETHVAPMVRMGGHADEIAIELRASGGGRVQALATLASRGDLAAPDGAIRVVVLDARERRAYEEELRAARARAERSEARISTLHHVAAALVAAPAPADVAEVLVDEAAKLLGASCAWVWEVDADALVQVAVSAGADLPPLRLLPVSTPSPPGDALRTGRAVAIEGAEAVVAQVPPLVALQPDVPSRLVAAPLEAQGRCLAVAQLGFDADERVADDELDLEVVRTICRQAGQAYQRATLYLSESRARAEAEHAAATDPLTGVANRRLFLAQLERELARAGRQETTTAVVLLDLDWFKQVNDGFGHSAGDAVLIEATRRFSARLRRSDLLARWGGEEFVALCPDVRTADAALALGDALRAALAATPVRLPDGTTLRITASVGVACAQGAGSSVDALIRAADQALYRAKRRGRDRSVLHVGGSSPTA